jgi:hypothetical protein
VRDAGEVTLAHGLDVCWVGLVIGTHHLGQKSKNRCKLVVRFTKIFLDLVLKMRGKLCINTANVDKVFLWNFLAKVDKTTGLLLIRIGLSWAQMMRWQGSLRFCYKIQNKTTSLN